MRNITTAILTLALGSLVAPLAHAARGLPEELLALAPSPNGRAPKHWRVESVPRLWLECRPIALSATLPSTPTGVCGYN